MFGYAIQSILGRALQASTIPSVVRGMLLYANAATRTGVDLSVARAHRGFPEIIKFTSEIQLDVTSSAARIRSRLSR